MAPCYFTAIDGSMGSASLSSADDLGQFNRHRILLDKIMMTPIELIQDSSISGFHISLSFGVNSWPRMTLTGSGISPVCMGHTKYFEMVPIATRLMFILWGICTISSALSVENCIIVTSVLVRVWFHQYWWHRQAQRHQHSASETKKDPNVSRHVSPIISSGEL